MFSDWGDAEHGGGLRHSEDGDAHQSFLRWDQDLIVLEVNIRINMFSLLSSLRALVWVGLARFLRLEIPPRDKVSAKLQNCKNDKRTEQPIILDDDNLKIDPRWATEEEAADPAFDPE